MQAQSKKSELQHALSKLACHATFDFKDQQIKVQKEKVAEIERLNQDLENETKRLYDQLEIKT